MWVQSQSRCVRPCASHPAHKCAAGAPAGPDNQAQRPPTGPAPCTSRKAFQENRHAQSRGDRSAKCLCWCRRSVRLAVLKSKPAPSERELGRTVTGMLQVSSDRRSQNAPAVPAGSLGSFKLPTTGRVGFHAGCRARSPRRTSRGALCHGGHAETPRKAGGGSPKASWWRMMLGLSLEAES